MPHLRSCSWCHRLNAIPTCPTWCTACSHRADLPRADCTCPACQGGRGRHARTSAAAPIPFVATIAGDGILAEADTFDGLLAQVRYVHEPDRGESVAIWRRPGKLVAIIRPDGSLLRLKTVEEAALV